MDLKIMPAGTFPELERMVPEGLITIEKVRVIAYRGKREG